MDSFMKGIIRKFINELTELQDEPFNSQSINKLGRKIREMEENLVSIQHDLSDIEVYERVKQGYIKAIQELNKFIEE